MSAPVIYKKPELPSFYFPAFKAALGSLEGKVFVITGTTSGTGQVAAETIAEKGGRVYMLNRPSPRAAAIQETLSQRHPDGRVSTIDCDLQRFQSVRRAAAELSRRCGDSGVDVLINNAGVMALADVATEDGFDIQMQTNHLSHFLLTQALFKSLTRAAELPLDP